MGKDRNHSVISDWSLLYLSLKGCKTIGQDRNLSNISDWLLLYLSLKGCDTMGQDRNQSDISDWSLPYLSLKGCDTMGEDRNQSIISDWSPLYLSLRGCYIMGKDRNQSDISDWSLLYLPLKDCDTLGKNRNHSDISDWSLLYLSLKGCDTMERRQKSIHYLRLITAIFITEGLWYNGEKTEINPLSQTDHCHIYHWRAVIQWGEDRNQSSISDWSLQYLSLKGCDTMERRQKSIHYLRLIAAIFITEGLWYNGEKTEINLLSQTDHCYIYHWRAVIQWREDRNQSIISDWSLLYLSPKGCDTMGRRQKSIWYLRLITAIFITEGLWYNGEKTEINPLSQTDHCYIYHWRAVIQWREDRNQSDTSDWSLPYLSLKGCDTMERRQKSIHYLRLIAAIFITEGLWYNGEETEINLLSQTDRCYIYLWEAVI